MLGRGWGSPPGLELLGAERVGDVLDGVTEAVGEVVGGVDTPGVASVGVRGVLDAVGHRVLLAVLHNVLHTKCGLGQWKTIADFRFVYTYVHTCKQNFFHKQLLTRATYT